MDRRPHTADSPVSRQLTIPFLAALALSGCATCREHPVVCTATAVAAAAGIAIPATHHGHGQTVPVRVPVIHETVTP